MLDKLSTYGACRGSDTEQFFPVGNVGPGQQQEQAKQVCHWCPVKNDCLTWALEHGEDGVWGGTTTKDRERIRRARKKRAA